MEIETDRVRCGRRRGISLLAAVLLGCAVSGVLAGPTESALFEAHSANGDVAVVRFSAAAVQAATAARRPLVVRSFPLPTGARIDLEVEPFFVTGERTRFVVGQKGGLDRVSDFDPGRLSFFRGTVRGRPGSHVFLSIGASGSSGAIDLGPAGRRFRVSSRDGAGRELASHHVSVFETEGGMMPPPGVPLCGVEGLQVPTGTPDPEVGLKHLEFAVDADYEFFENFGNTEDTFTYLVALVAEISAIYMRDVDTWVELSFARIWDDPDDLFNDVDPSPLGEFQDHWNTYMGGVQRDTAMLVSGRRDYPFGGIAYVSAMCGSNAYGAVGYMTGFFPDPTKPSPEHYDIFVVAHELGHNAGTGHTQNNGIDACHLPSSTPQRGTIMSYCQQTWSGGSANQDLYFHSIIQQNIDNHLNSSSCIVPDCNLNGIDDADDVNGASADVNSNDIPDECEDCNGNFVLDDDDISGATSLDLNGNGIPDECEPDCDANLIPDDKQIDDATSLDAYGNDIPDECETDCNTNGISDYTEIQLEIGLDIDRDAALDACQDCDGDGTTDHAELGGAHNVWVASGLDNSVIREFYSTTGVLMQSSSSLVKQGQDLIVTDNERVLVSSALDDRVLEFDLTGSYVGDLVAAGSGGLDYPTGLIRAADGTLLVASRDTNSVLAYDGVTGLFQGAFVSAGSGGLAAPFGLTFGPGGNLFVTSDAGEVLEYDAQDGSFVAALVAAAANGGLDAPRGLIFKPDGNLLVASYGTDEVLEYDGSTGAALGKWAQVGTANNLNQASPWGIRIGPNGNVFVIRTGDAFGAGSLGNHLDHHHAHHEDGSVQKLHLTNAQIYEFDVLNGNFIRAYIGGNDHGMLFPSGFDFVPGWSADCNVNQLPDECDISSGASADGDLSGVPDECEIDCNANGVLDRLDVIPFGSAVDCNANLVPDGCDLASGTSLDCTLNGIPDECEPDCNGNGLADSCEIDTGSSTDCNANEVPDECDSSFDFESDQGWTSSTLGDTASDGTWVRVNPVGTSAQTEFDHTAGSGRECWVTGQGAVGGAAETADVDGGKTTLFSPLFDLSLDPDPEIGYWRWYSNDTGDNPGSDVFEVEISANGLFWVNVETVGPTGPEASGGWFYHKFRVADFVTPSASSRLRFVARDDGGSSTIEAAVDDVVLLAGCCQTAAACDDGFFCTIDSCNAAAGQCSSAVDASSCLIDHVCYASGDLNPADDCQDCDPTLPGGWSDASPVGVGALVLDRTGSTTLSWTGQGAGFVYDIAGELLSQLRLDGDVEAAICVADDVAVPTWDDPRPDPPSGVAYYYLVRAQKSCGAGSYGESSSGVERQPASACP